jgi:hypothetical protein
MTPKSRFPRLHRPAASIQILAVLTLLLTVATRGHAESAPSGSHLCFPGNTVTGAPGHGYLEVPFSPALNPISGFTLEAWVKLDPGGAAGCRSLAGMNLVQGWWVGYCNGALRSRLKGGGSERAGGTIPEGKWTHVAVTYGDGTRRHYVDGELVMVYAETGPLDTSTSPLRLGSDVGAPFSPAGCIDEVRLWSVPRTPAQIANNHDVAIDTAQPNLAEVWSFDGESGEGGVNGHDGLFGGVYSFGELSPPPGGPWLTTGQLPGFRFKVRIGGDAAGTRVNDCVPETLCVAGAIPTRTEVFVRIIGPRNGYLWPSVIRFTAAQVEVWIEQLSSGEVAYYRLERVPVDVDELNGLVDRTGFLF